MNEKTLRVLEYYKVLELLESKADSELGKEMTRKLKPSSNLKKVKFAQNETEEAYRVIMKENSPSFSGLYDIKDELNLSSKGGMLSPGALLRIGQSLRTGRKVKSFLLRKDFENINIIKKIAENISIHKDIEEEIFTAILGEDEISSDASTELRNIRRNIQNKNTGIRNRLQSIINSSESRKYLQDSIVTIREGRHVIPVRQEYRNMVKGIIHDQSSSGATLFIEPIDIVNLNNELRELKLAEEKEIDRILTEITASIGEVHQNIKYNLKQIARLDFIFAKAKLAIDMDATPPNVNLDGKINIKRGRHPLIDKDEVIASDFYLGDPTNTIVITGPNTGGKTVTLKTVGLITLMGQSGLQIPADSNSDIAVFNNIYADIGDEQSIEQSLSTFSSHMTNIVHMLDNIEDNSLLLFDELGAGTDPTEGAALAISILDYLLDKNIRTIATTHYSELKLHAISKEGIENASVEFDIETLRPTYKLLIGVPGRSNAFEISRRLGLQDHIIDSAKNLIDSESVKFEEILGSIEQDRRSIEKSKESTKKLEAEIIQLRNELDKQKRILEDNREDIIIKAKREARSIIDRAKRESEDALKEINEIKFEIDEEKKKRLDKAKRKLGNKIDYIDPNLSEKILSKTSIKPLEDVEIGEEVRVLSLDQEGTVVSKVDPDGNVMVQIGVMKISVPLDTIELSNKKGKKSTSQYAKNMISKKSKIIKNEIDIRGMNVEEAHFEIDKYLDDAYLSGLKEVSIIHGKGTGVLRAGINEILKKHQHVKSQRIGKFNEGGTGVTVVSLK
ncbi:MAG: endonuclease MutS2 [Andreesenia angusta]|nr:endonuclease MutS2 [Andreesenia angusta]